MPANEAEARRPAKVRKAQAPSAQTFLRQAMEFQARLVADSTLKRTRLAREAGITPTRLTQILHLLDLPPQIRRTVLALKPAIGRGLTEKKLRAIVQDQDRRSQERRFKALLAQRQRPVVVSPESESGL